MSIRTLNGLVLPRRPEFTRDIVSIPERRTANFNDEYDFHTLFYDAFYVQRRDALCLICPPLLNLEKIFRSAQWRADGRRLRIAALYPHKRFVEVWMRGAAKAPRELRFTFDDVDARAAVSPGESELFAGLRCGVVKSRNNDLNWIRDWAEYHVKVHGLEGVLLFDHGSDRYGVEDVEATLLSVPGVKRACVIPSPYPFGPTTDDNALFLQVGELNIARLRFFARAAGVLVCDIDELVAPSPDGSVFETARKSFLGYALFHGSWRYPETHDGEDGPRLHREHVLKRVGQPDCQTKYCVRPQGLSGAAHWDIHGSIRGSLKPLLVTSRLHYWHCYGVSTGWKVDRSDVQQAGLALHAHTAAVMSDVFPAPVRAPEPVGAGRTLEFESA